MLDSSELSTIPLFAKLNPLEMEPLSRAVRHQRFRAGEIICHKGDTGDRLYLVGSGQVKVSVTSMDGRESILCILGPGDCFGELAVLDGRPRSADVTALEPVETACILRDDFVSFLRNSPDASLRVLEVLAGRLRNTDELLEEVVFFDVYGRVAKALVKLAQSHGHTNARDGGTLIDLRLTQQDLASWVGATRESVNKVMNFYRRAGYLESAGGRRIRLLNLEPLIRRARQ